jgi:hypothetical protein
MCAGPALGLLISQGHDHRQPRLVPHPSCDMALTGQVFSEDYIPRADALDGPVPDLDLRLPG